MNRYILIILVVVAAGWYYLTRPAPPNPPLVPSLVLTPYVDSILSPVTTRHDTQPRQQLLAAKEQFRVESIPADPASRAAYNAGGIICDTLISAITAREAILASLSDSEAKQGALFDPRTKQTFSNNRPFFDAQIHRRWGEESARRRQQLELMLSQLRTLELQANLTAQPAPRR